MAKPPIKEKYIKTPEELWALFEAYVIHERDSPLFKREYVGKNGEEKDTPLQVPITFEGFECYLADIGVIEDLGNYSSNLNDSYTAYLPIISRIRKNCFVQNFKGAAVGLFSAQLISRKLGLVDKQQSEVRQQPFWIDNKSE